MAPTLWCIYSICHLDETTRQLAVWRLFLALDDKHVRWLTEAWCLFSEKMLVAWVQSNSTSLLHVFVSTYHLDEMKRPSAVRRLFLQTGRRVCLPVSSGKRANLQKSLMSLAPGNALQCSHAKGCELKKGQAWSARRLAKGVLKRFCTEAKKFQGRCAQVTNGRK